ncbi:MAG: hypothetical protein AB7F79_00310 [Steroidobacteraceae bacterium]
MSITQAQGTAELGKAALLMTLVLQGVTVNAATTEGLQASPSVRAAGLPETRRTSSCVNTGSQGTQSVAGSSVISLAEIDNSVLRPTTKLEKLVGELRSWRLLTANWDGEGAKQPSDPSLKQAELFARLYQLSAIIPETMLNANGHAGLTWNEPSLYADLEFLGDGRLAYYIERNGDKHKGVTRFNSEEVPAVLKVLLSA